MVNKDGASNSMQKGKRRQKLNDKQDNVGNNENSAKYTNYEGKPLK